MEKRELRREERAEIMDKEGRHNEGNDAKEGLGGRMNEG